MYHLAEAYYNYHGNLLIPYEFKTTNGYDYDDKGYSLGIWFNNQRLKWKGLTSERREKLEKIGFIINIHDYKWQKFYELAKTYYEHYGNLEVSYNFCTLDGYNYDEGGASLGTWISTQRYMFEQLSDSRKELLLKIGMRFENKNSTLSWEEMLEYAKIFYMEHHNLYVPTNYVTSDGTKLGRWIGNQRYLTSPESERGIILSSMGMIWNIRKNKDGILSLCMQYGIDYNKNKSVLRFTSIYEFQSKIEFLKSLNVSIINVYGILHEIFSMSSVDMEEKYGMSLEKIILTYCIDNIREKGL